MSDTFRLTKIRECGEIGFDDIAHVMEKAREDHIALVDFCVETATDQLRDRRDAQLVQLQRRHDLVCRVDLTGSLHANYLPRRSPTIFASVSSAPSTFFCCIVKKSESVPMGIAFFRPSRASSSASV